MPMSAERSLSFVFRVVLGLAVVGLGFGTLTGCNGQPAVVESETDAGDEAIPGNEDVPTAVDGTETEDPAVTNEE